MESKSGLKVPWEMPRLAKVLSSIVADEAELVAVEPKRFRPRSTTRANPPLVRLRVEVVAPAMSLHTLPSVEDYQ